MNYKAVLNKDTGLKELDIIKYLLHINALIINKCYKCFCIIFSWDFFLKKRKLLCK